MSIVRTQIRQGAYYDSVVLMQLQKSLIALPGILDAGVVMATDANKELLQQNNLLSIEANAARAEDLLIAVSARDESIAQAALARVDELLARRRSSVDQTYRPKSLDSALQMLPDAQWVLVSVPGRYAAGVARDALGLNRHVFLYSDNVALEDEIALKQTAREKGLLVMGPDCGTALINGVGLGFANRVRRGTIGIVGASGTGIQTVTVGIHRLGEGISHAIGTGTNDLKDAVGAVTTLQGLEWQSRDPQTQAIVLISKPPSPAVAARVLDAARRAGKPVVIDFIGYAGHDEGNLFFANTLDDAARIAVMLSETEHPVIRKAEEQDSSVAEFTLSKANVLPLNDKMAPVLPRSPAHTGFLRGLYSGGTLAYEAQFILRDYLPTIYSNAPLDPKFKLHSPHVSQEHTIIDLGSEEFMVGRLHPMIDNDLRIRRLRQEADDPNVAVILFDVVLGYGAHPDPASELAPAIADAQVRAQKAGRMLQFVAVVIGTDEDPQNYANQVERLQAAGVRVMSTHQAAVRLVGEMLGNLRHRNTEGPEKTKDKGILSEAKRPVIRKVREQDSSVAEFTLSKANVLPQNDNLIAAFNKSFAAINVGIESFFDSLKQQGVPVVQVDWKPPAGGNEKLMAILEKLKSKQ